MSGEQGGSDLQSQTQKSFLEPHILSTLWANSRPRLDEESFNHPNLDKDEIIENEDPDDSQAQEFFDTRDFADESVLHQSSKVLFDTDSAEGSRKSLAFVHSKIEELFEFLTFDEKALRSYIKKPNCPELIVRGAHDLAKIWQGCELQGVDVPIMLALGTLLDEQLKQPQKASRNDPFGKRYGTFPQVTYRMLDVLVQVKNISYNLTFHLVEHVKKVQDTIAMLRNQSQGSIDHALNAGRYRSLEMLLEGYSCILLASGTLWGSTTSYITVAKSFHNQRDHVARAIVLLLKYLNNELKFTRARMNYEWRGWSWFQAFGGRVVGSTEPKVLYKLLKNNIAGVPLLRMEMERIIFEANDLAERLTAAGEDFMKNSNSLKILEPAGWIMESLPPNTDSVFRGLLRHYMYGEPSNIFTCLTDDKMLFGGQTGFSIDDLVLEWLQQLERLRKMPFLNRTFRCITRTSLSVNTAMDSTASLSVGGAFEISKDVKIAARTMLDGDNSSDYWVREAMRMNNYLDGIMDTFNKEMEKVKFQTYRSSDGVDELDASLADLRIKENQNQQIGSPKSTSLSLIHI